MEIQLLAIRPSEDPISRTTPTPYAVMEELLLV